MSPNFLETAVEIQVYFVTGVMDWLWCVAGLSVVSVMIVSWSLSPVAAEAKPGDGWRRPSLNRGRPSLSEQVCTTRSRRTNSDWHRHAWRVLPPPPPSSVTHHMMLTHTVTVSCTTAWIHRGSRVFVLHVPYGNTHTHNLHQNTSSQSPVDASVCVCVCVCDGGGGGGSGQQDMCARVMAEANHLFCWVQASLLWPLPWWGCPTDVLVVFSAALFLVSPRLF